MMMADDAWRRAVEDEILRHRREGTADRQSLGRVLERRVKLREVHFLDARQAALDLADRMERMIADEGCECSPEGHHCGIPDARREIGRIRAGFRTRAEPRLRPLWALGAWLFGYVPIAVQLEVESKHPGSRVIGFRRGPSIDLTKQKRHLAFVAAPELMGIVVLDWTRPDGRPSVPRNRVD